jgi:iron complex outermembrane receptor protein
MFSNEPLLPMSFELRLHPLAAAAAFVALSAQAQTADTQRLEPIQVQGRAERDAPLDRSAAAGSRLGLTLRETPASVEVITQEQMQLRGARTLEEALRGAVGVSVGGNPGGPGQASTRGFTGGFITYLFDGARVSTPGMSNRPQDSFNYERVEVLKGPSSVLFGEGGIGGAVNFVPKQARRGASGTQAVLAAGSYGALRAAVGTGGDLGETGAYRLDYSHNQSKGWVDRTDSRMDHLTGGLAFALTPAVKLDLTLDANRDDIGAYNGTPLVPASFATEPTSVVSDSSGRVIDKRLARQNYNVADGLMESSSLWLRAKLAWQLAPGWHLRNELSHYSADRHWRNSESASFAAPDRVNRDQVDVAHDHTVWGDRLDLAHQGAVFGLANRFIAGLEFNRTRFGSERRFSDGSASTNAALQVAALNPAVGVYNNSPTLATGGGNRTDSFADIDVNSAFIEDAIKPVQGLTVVAGWRQDRIALKRRIEDLNLATTTRFEKDYRATSLRLGAVAELSAATSLYAQWADAAAPVGSSNLLLLSAANTAYPLTRGKQWEAGLKQSVSAELDWTLAVYKITQNNVLSRDPANPALTVNNGQISSKGLELSARWRATRGLTLSGNLAALSAQFDNLIEAGGVSRVGNRPTNVPERTANLWADYRLDGLPVNVGASLQRVGDMFTNNANTVRINGYTLADAYASWQASPAALLTLRVRNLGDKLYGSWGGASAANQIVLGAPRTVELTAKLDF